MKETHLVMRPRPVVLNLSYKLGSPQRFLKHLKYQGYTPRQIKSESLGWDPGINSVKYPQMTAMYT